MNNFAVMFGKFCVRTAVGLAIGMGILLLNMEIDEAIGMLLVVVICTAGLSLLIIIPVAYVVGLIVTIWFIPMGGKKWSYSTTGREPPPIPHQKQNKQTPKNRVLLKFIEESQNQGKNFNQIEAELIQTGWPEEEVHRHLSDIEKREQ